MHLQEVVEETRKVGCANGAARIYAIYIYDIYTYNVHIHMHIQEVAEEIREVGCANGAACIYAIYIYDIYPFNLHTHMCQWMRATLYLSMSLSYSLVCACVYTYCGVYIGSGGRDSRGGTCQWSCTCLAESLLITSCRCATTGRWNVYIRGAIFLLTTKSRETLFSVLRNVYKI